MNIDDTQIREWMRERLGDYLVSSEVVQRRISSAVRRGVPVVSTYLTDVPPAGSQARQEWETTCDGCSRWVQPPEVMTVINLGFDHLAVPLTLQVTATLCGTCMKEKFGIDQDDLPSLDRDEEADTAHALVDVLTKAFPGESFGIVIGESPEASEAAMTTFREGRDG